MSRRAAGGALAAALFTISMPAAAAIPATAAQSEQAAMQPGPDGTLIHEASGFAFPASLAGFGAVGENVFAPDNVMVRYGAAGPEDGAPWVDLFIYPGEGTLPDEAAEVGRIIADRYGATQIADPGPLPAAASDGRQGWYQAKMGPLDARTGYVVVRRNGWSMKVRSTVPDSSGPEGMAAALTAIAAVGWNWQPQKAPAPVPDGDTVAAR